MELSGAVAAFAQAVKDEACSISVEALVDAADALRGESEARLRTWLGAPTMSSTSPLKTNPITHERAVYYGVRVEELSVQAGFVFGRYSRVELHASGTPTSLELVARLLRAGVDCASLAGAVKALIETHRITRETLVGIFGEEVIALGRGTTMSLGPDGVEIERRHEALL